ncbi:MAG: oxygen-dependent coproporphyrinogen oxidase [Actinobacteria bacterium]|nr:oxygen-dependent coproporphyrinogen oxidase [Actinomycetota bacterium]
MDRSTIEAGYRSLQDQFCAAIEGVDGTAPFRRDHWERPGGGGGETRVLEGHGTIEKAAVNVSAVWGDMPSQVAGRMAAAGDRFFATGISIIVHPANPHAPAFHANLRYFELDGDTAWFGGGSDLTPCYLYEEDARHFHGTLQAACDRHDVADYAAWKRWCDEYFFLPHRGEARGIGGVFFDHLIERLPEVWAFQQDLGSHLSDAYIPILERRSAAGFSGEQRSWQELRRGRYAEFNLVWDRGTRFGLETGGRVESILASLPPRARWAYDAEPAEGTPEAALLELVRGPARSWA